MRRKKAKNKLNNKNNNAEKNDKKGPKTSTNPVQNSEYQVNESQAQNKKCHGPNVNRKNNEFTRLIAQKISIFSKNTKVWIQRESKNALESIEKSKKEVVKTILRSTKSFFTKILETIDQTLDPAKISNLKSNQKAANQYHEVSNKIPIILPLLHSSPNINCNQISNIQSPRSQSKIQSSISRLLEITSKNSKSKSISFKDPNIPEILKSKCKQPLQQLMSIDVKPSHELQTKILFEQVKNHIELKIKEINNNKLHGNNPFNKDQIPRLYPNSNLSETYESEQNYPGIVICYCEYECEHANNEYECDQYDHESPNIEESYLLKEYVDNVEYEIDEDYSKNDSTDISYDE